MTAATTNAIPIEVVTNGPGDQSPEPKSQIYNKLFNSQFACGKVTGSNVEVRAAMNTCSYTNATPVVVTTPYNHNLNTGDDVIIRASENASGQGIDGYWIITKTAANAFSLNGSTAPGIAATASVYPNQSGLVGVRTPFDSVFGGQSYFWSPWFSDTDTEGGGADVFEYVSNGIQQSGEILFKGSTVTGPATHVLGQQIAFRGVPPISGVHMTFSVYLKCATSPSNMTFNVCQFTGDGPVSGTVSGTQLTSTYKRFSWNWAFALNNANFEASFEPTVTSGTGADIFISRPTFVVGDVIPAWTPFLDATFHTPNNADLVAAWSRTVSQVITRDASAPYA